MNLKLCAIGALGYALKNYANPRSTKSVPSRSGNLGQSIPKQAKFDSSSILAAYNRGLVVESNLK